MQPLGAGPAPIERLARADELAEFVAIYWAQGRQPLSAQVKKGLASAFGKFDEYALAPDCLSPNSSPAFTSQSCFSGLMICSTRLSQRSSWDLWWNRTGCSRRRRWGLVSGFSVPSEIDSASARGDK